jgi:hypothetical protein
VWGLTMLHADGLRLQISSACAVSQ